MDAAAHEHLSYIKQSQQLHELLVHKGHTLSATQKEEIYKRLQDKTQSIKSAASYEKREPTEQRFSATDHEHLELVKNSQQLHQLLTNEGGTVSSQSLENIYKRLEEKVNLLTTAAAVDDSTMAPHAGAGEKACESQLHDLLQKSEELHKLLLENGLTLSEDDKQILCGELEDQVSCLLQSTNDGDDRICLDPLDGTSGEIGEEAWRLLKKSRELHHLLANEGFKLSKEQKEETSQQLQNQLATIKGLDMGRDVDGSSDESKVQELIATSEELHELLLSSKASEMSTEHKEEICKLLHDEVLSLNQKDYEVGPLQVDSRELDGDSKTLICKSQELHQLLLDSKLKLSATERQEILKELQDITSSLRREPHEDNVPHAGGGEEPCESELHGLLQKSEELHKLLLENGLTLSGENKQKLYGEIEDQVNCLLQPPDGGDDRICPEPLDSTSSETGEETWRLLKKSQELHHLFANEGFKLSQEQKDEMFQQLQDQLTSIKELDTRRDVEGSHDESGSKIQELMDASEELHELLLNNASEISTEHKDEIRKLLHDEVLSLNHEDHEVDPLLQVNSRELDGDSKTLIRESQELHQLLLEAKLKLSATERKEIFKELHDAASSLRGEPYEDNVPHAGAGEEPCESELHGLLQKSEELHKLLLENGLTLSGENKQKLYGEIEDQVNCLLQSPDGGDDRICQDPLDGTSNEIGEEAWRVLKKSQELHHLLANEGFKLSQEQKDEMFQQLQDQLKSIKGLDTRHDVEGSHDESGSKIQELIDASEELHELLLNNASEISTEHKDEIRKLLHDEVLSLNHEDHEVDPLLQVNSRELDGDSKTLIRKSQELHQLLLDAKLKLSATERKEIFKELHDAASSLRGEPYEDNRHDVEGSHDESGSKIQELIDASEELHELLLNNASEVSTEHKEEIRKLLHDEVLSLNHGDDEVGPLRVSSRELSDDSKTLICQSQELHQLLLNAQLKLSATEKQELLKELQDTTSSLRGEPHEDNRSSSIEAGEGVDSCVSDLIKKSQDMHELLTSEGANLSSEKRMVIYKEIKDVITSLTQTDIKEDMISPEPTDDYEVDDNVSSLLGNCQELHHLLVHEGAKLSVAEKKEMCREIHESISSLRMKAQEDKTSCNDGICEDTDGCVSTLMGKSQDMHQLLINEGANLSSEKLIGIYKEIEDQVNSLQQATDNGAMASPGQADDSTWCEEMGDDKWNLMKKSQELHHLLHSEGHKLSSSKEVEVCKEIEDKVNSLQQILTDGDMKSLD